MFDRVIEELKAFKPFNEQEERDLPLMLSLLKKNEDIFYRSNLTCHMTASGWVVNKNRDKVLMAYHNLYDSWAWLGGHADGCEDLLAVAMKEVKEESGLTDVRPVSEKLFSLEILTVNGHVKKGKYVPSHLHLNLTYLLEADEESMLQNKADENSAVSWFSPEEALIKSTEPWFVDHVYSKLIEKVRNL